MIPNSQSSISTAQLRKGRYKLNHTVKPVVKRTARELLRSIRSVRVSEGTVCVGSSRHSPTTVARARHPSPARTHARTHARTAGPVDAGRTGLVPHRAASERSHRWRRSAGGGDPILPAYDRGGSGRAATASMRGSAERRWRCCRCFPCAPHRIISCGRCAVAGISSSVVGNGLWIILSTLSRGSSVEKSTEEHSVTEKPETGGG